MGFTGTGKILTLSLDPNVLDHALRGMRHLVPASDKADEHVLAS